MIIKEVLAKTILSKSQVFPYVINPYTGCQHNCRYCYARFMKRFTGHMEPWGQFVDAKINASELLRKEIVRKMPERVWMSGVCDPYQPLDEKYQLTRQCLSILMEKDWPINLQTKSPLVLRDIELLKQGSDVEVGFSIPTAEEDIKRMFEPEAPPIVERVQALEHLHNEGIKTFVMIAPVLPGAENLPKLLEGKVDFVLVDRINYHYADWVYHKYGLEQYLGDGYYQTMRSFLSNAFSDVQTRLIA